MLLAQMLILPIMLSRPGQSWRAPCCHQSLWSLQEPPSGNQKSGDRMKRWTKLYKHAWFKVYSALNKGGMMAEAEETKTAYIDAKHVTKHAIWLAKSEVEKEEFATVWWNGDGVFWIAKQMDCRNQDIVDENCVRNDAGELVLTDEDKMKPWVEHFARLLNVEFEWPSNELPEVLPTQQFEGPQGAHCLAPLPVCPRPRSTKHLAKWNAARLLAHLAS